MKLIIGLGNPGSEYFNTRHNFGFLALNFFQDSQAFPAWNKDEKFKSLLSEGQINGEKIILAKPETYMNNSGQAVKLLADYYKIAPQDIWIIHDELALPLGVLRINAGSSAAGHNGIKSIIDSLGTQDFIRFRLGIALKEGFFSSLFKKTAPAEKFVLQKFGSSEKKLVQEATQKTREAILLAAEKGVKEAQNKFN